MLIKIELSDADLFAVLAQYVEPLGFALEDFKIVEYENSKGKYEATLTVDKLTQAKR